MSLVAYEASSDEESNHSEEEEGEGTTAAAIINGLSSLPAKGLNGGHTSGKISDDEEDYAPAEFSPLSGTETSKLSAPSLSLPKPKNSSETKVLDEEIEVTPIFSKLPTPKNTIENKTIIEEEDDEFLHKKATLPLEELKPKPVNVLQNKGPVKITIPSLKEFSDVDKDMTNKAKNKPLQAGQKKSSLLSMLPQAKSERNFTKSAVKLPNNDSDNIATQPKPSSVNRFIPDTVKNRRPAYNTEGVDGVRRAYKKPLKPTDVTKISLVNCSESEESGDEGGDFFSLNSEDKLPEVSKNEIDDLIAKRAAKMMKAKEKFFNDTTENKNSTVENMEVEDDALDLEGQQKQAILNREAMQALAGSRAKRRKDENIQVLDISSAEVLPSREEWMRTALASSTAYQPTGVLVDEEPAAGTRRKHQITYLAHKAKANEAELQAMWAANRQNRKATQSKYGF
uniref:Proline-rich protein PRCC n=1 Tax=Ceratitis capitata TaxID=7213 RepID=W8BZN9_CERCA